MKHLSVPALVVMLSACSSAPTVGYQVINSPSDLNPKQIAVYGLQENVVTIKSSKSKDKEVVTASLARADHMGIKIALIERGSLGVKTNLTITKFENTDIPSEIAVKVDDQRVETIGAIGGVVVDAIKSGFVPFAVRPDPALPLRINLSKSIGKKDRGQIVVPNLNGLYVVYEPVPVDAVEISNPQFDQKSSYFYYAACRQAIVSFKLKNENYQYVFKVSDPNFLQRVRMPADGKIKMHSQCGASVSGKITTDSDASNLAIVSALLAQGKSIKEAIEAENKDSTDASN